MRHSVLAIAAIFATLTQASAQTPTEMLEHIDDLGRTNEKLQERVRTLENDNKALRERQRQFGAGEPGPASVAPQPVPATAAPRIGEQGPASVAPQPVPTTAAPRIGDQGPAPRTLPLPSAGPSLAGTIDLDSDPRGAQAATSLGSGCKTPCAMEISADAPFTVTFTHPGYAPATVDIGMQPGQPGVSNPKFSPNPVFVQLTPEARKKPAVSGPQKLGPAR
jgi:hypothetical protein